MMVESRATRSPAEPAAILESRTRVTGLSAWLYSEEASSPTHNAGAECSGGEAVADILAIDDDDDLRDTLRAILEKGGHTVHEARNGREGVACCQAHSIALVITDLLMPEQEGIETIRQLRVLDPAPTIIAMSGGGLLEGQDLLHIATM
jgi:PleD family two-component response regulator